MPQPVSECLYYKLRRDWVDRFQILTLQSESSSGATAAETESLTGTSRLQMGWALQKKHAGVRFSQKVNNNNNNNNVIIIIIIIIIHGKL